MSDDDYPSLVIDNGSSFCRAGFAGDDAPKAISPTFSESREKRWKHFLNTGRYSVIDNGTVLDWDDMESIWNNMIVQDLKICPENHPVLLSESLINKKSAREKAISIFFETYKSPSFYLANTAVLSSFSAGCLTTAVVESGLHMTYTVPVYEGYALSHAIEHIEIAGHSITMKLKEMLNKRRYFLQNDILNVEEVNKIKEKFGYVKLSHKKETETESSYVMPDGNSISITNEEKYEPIEILFKPSPCGHNVQGIPELLSKSISKADNELRTWFYRNIVLSGSTTIFPGFRNRLENGLYDFILPNTRLNVLAPRDCERKYSAWIGGSIFASLSSFDDMVVTKEEYEETGPSIVHRKCF